MRYIALCFSAFLVLIDQLVKSLVITYVKPQPIPVIKDIFYLNYLENRGAAFGVMDGKGGLLIVLTILAILVGIFLIMFNKIKSKFLMWSVALIIGGGIGNLIDRIFRGFVVDYIEIRAINFAVFNLADCCVVIGTILMMGYILFSKNDNPQNELIVDLPVGKNDE